MLKLKSRVVKKTVNLSTMEEDLKAKGFDVNTESLRSRSKVRRSIADIEQGQDRLAGHVLDDSDDGDVIEDDDIAMQEADKRGRKGDKKRLRREVDEDEDMEGVAAAKKGRTSTP